MDHIFDVSGKLHIDMRAKNWCKLPYPAHKDGCPNYNKNKLCPPNSPDVDKFIKIYRKHWFIVEYFNIKEFENKMKIKHPEWSKKQCRCLLYWQKGVKSRLTKKALKFINGNDELIYTLLPEALGVHVFKTAESLKIPIEKKPKDWIIKIALVGYKNFDDRQKNILEWIK